MAGRSAIPRSQKKRRIPDRKTAACTPHPEFLVPRHRHEGYTGFTNGVAGSRHWSGRFRFISTRTAIGRPRGYRLFAFCPRNDVLRVSAYMQPSDRAWQIGFAGVCMCIVHHRRTDHARAHTAFIGVRAHVQEAEAGRYLEGGCGVTCIANGSPPRSSAPSLERIYIYIYSFLIAPSTNRRSFEGESRGSPDRDPQISRKNNYRIRIANRQRRRRERRRC